MGKGKGGSKTQTTTENSTGSGSSATNYAPWIGNLQQYVAGTGAGLAQPFLQNVSPYAVAGFNPDQQKGFDLARGMAQDQFTQGATQAPNGTSYTEFMNPYLQDVGKSAVNTMRRENVNNLAQADARAASTSAFGGSGSALERAQLARGYNQDSADAVLGILSGGYDRANSLAFQKSQLEDQFRNSALDRQSSALNTLLGVGNQQQGLAQQQIDVPWEMLSRLQGLTPQVYASASSENKTSNTKSTQPVQRASPLQSMLGAGLSILGAPVTGGGSIAGKLFGY